MKRFLLLILLVLPAVLQCQVVDEALEHWMGEEGSEEAAAELSDLLHQLRSEPFNLNDTASFAELPLLSYFQRTALRNYIMLHGQLLSLKELFLVPGFDSATVSAIEPYVMVAPIANYHAFRPWSGRHTLVGGLSGTVEQAAGYGNGHYAGDNMRALLCYSYNYRNHINLRFAADKDAGEKWGRDNYYSYHLVISEIGRIERLIVGRYNLRFGQGLTLWTGMQPFDILGTTHMRYGGGVRPAGTFYETDYQEGVAATLHVGRNVYLTGFASKVDGERLYGGHVETRRSNLIVGATAMYTGLDDSLIVRDYLYNGHRFRGDRMFNAGIDAAWQWRRLTVYSEAAADRDCHMAVVAGADVAVTSGNSLGISYRHYDTAYHNLHAGGYSIGTTQAEEGLALHTTLTLPLRVRALASVDLHSFPSLRYGSYTPSSGSWLRLQLSRKIGRHATAMLRYAYRQKERNVPYSDSNAYQSEQTMRRQIQGELRMESGPWLATLRTLAAWFDSENGVSQRGWAVAAMLRYTDRRMQTSFGAAWFDVDGYYARLFLSESTLQYAWSMPVLNGRGIRSYVQLRYSFTSSFAVAARYALVLMPGEESIGTGDAQTEGPLRQTWHLQFRWKF